jgi:hypothetical protein
MFRVIVTFRNWKEHESGVTSSYDLAREWARPFFKNPRVLRVLILTER